MYRTFFLAVLPAVHGVFTVSPAGSTLTQCSNVDLIWTEEPPIHLWAVPNREIDAGDPVLHDFGQINSTFLLWPVALPVGQNVSFTYVRMADTYQLYASDIAYTVVPGTNSSCFDGSSSVSSTLTTTAYSSTTSSSLSASVSLTLPSLSFNTSTTTSASISSEPIPSPSESGSKRNSSTSAIVGGSVAGGVAFLGCIGCFIWWYRHHSGPPHHTPPTRCYAETGEQWDSNSGTFGQDMSQAYGDSALPSQANLATGTQPIPNMSTVSTGIGASSSAVLPSEPWSDHLPFSPSEQWAVLPNTVESGSHTSGSEGTPNSTSARASLPETKASNLDYRYRRREIDAGVSIAVVNANDIDLETLPPAYEDRDRTENHV